MKKIIIALALIAASFSTASFADGKTNLAVVAGGNLALIIGDGRTSFGIHFDKRGFYDYRGQRFRSRAAYIRAVKKFEQQKLLALRLQKERKLVNSFSNRRSFNSGFNSRNSFNSFNSFNNGRFCK